MPWFDDYEDERREPAVAVKPQATRSVSLTTKLPDVYLAEKAVHEHGGIKKQAPKSGWYKAWLNARGQLRIAFDFSRANDPAPAA